MPIVHSACWGDSRGRWKKPAAVSQCSRQQAQCRNFCGSRSGPGVCVCVWPASDCLPFAGSEAVGPDSLIACLLARSIPPPPGTVGVDLPPPLFLSRGDITHIFQSLGSPVPLSPPPLVGLSVIGFQIKIWTKTQNTPTGCFNQDISGEGGIPQTRTFR